MLEDRGKSEYMPIVYDFCWNTGVHGYASVGQFDFGLAAQTGSLGSPNHQILYDRPNLAAHVNFVPGPWLTVGVWSAIGPYLSPQIKPTLPAGKKIEEYQQKTAGALLHVAEGHWDGYAEGIINRFEHPFLGLLDNVGGYADLRFEFATRWWVAARCDALSFSRLASDDPDVKGQRWDYPIFRYEAGVGRRMTERALLKAVVQIVRYQNAPHSLDDEIYAFQFTVKL
ncbi:MAG: hypothetical protein HY304_02660 [candidate division Zixibacteria bacterium]|nr:hypothetical protein [candidate division Zixibacteria bacterium]